MFRPKFRNKKAHYVLGSRSQTDIKHRQLLSNNYSQTLSNLGLFSLSPYAKISVLSKQLETYMQS